MTIRQKMEQMLYERGLFPEQAKAVMELAEVADGNECMRGRWGDEVSAYPPVLVNVAWMSIRRVALLWIDENCPGAWFRPLFTGETVKAAD